MRALRLARRFASGSVTNAACDTTVPRPPIKASRFEELSCFAKVHEIDGIWRAPRERNYTKEDFDRVYPPHYKGMRIGLPDTGTFASKYITAKFDEVSPLMWTCLIMSPFIIWGAIEARYVLFPSSHRGPHH